MKKNDIINLIKYHYTGDERGFRDSTTKIAQSFNASGDEQLAAYVMSFLAAGNTFVPQEYSFESRFFKKVPTETATLPLPEAVASDITGIINAVNHHIGVNKFLFEGAPGTGKTESVKQVARLLRRSLYMVNFNELIDSRMGQTAKNIEMVFNEINRMPAISQTVILFDELDAIAMDRVNANDVREMGRVTSGMLRELDRLNPDVVLIATTNLIKQFDRAFLRRFDTTINFDRYTNDDLVDVASSLLADDLKRFDDVAHDLNLFKKIIRNMAEIPSPGELKNLIKVSLAFSDPNDPYDYLKRLYRSTSGSTGELSIGKLRDEGFTLREIEELTGKSKSTVGRELKE